LIITAAAEVGGRACAFRIAKGYRLVEGGWAAEVLRSVASDLKKRGEEEEVGSCLMRGGDISEGEEEERSAVGTGERWEECVLFEGPVVGVAVLGVVEVPAGENEDMSERLLLEEAVVERGRAGGLGGRGDVPSVVLPGVLISEGERSNSLGRFLRCKGSDDEKEGRGPGTEGEVSLSEGEDT